MAVNQWCGQVTMLNQTFANDLGKQQALFSSSASQLFRPEMFADTASPEFYKQFVQSGISRDLSTGLIKELKDSGIALKDGAVDLYEAAKQNPGAVFSGLLDGVKGLPAGVVDSFKESGTAIGEGLAVATDADISAKLNAIYGQDVSTAQEAMLAIRLFTAITGAKGVATAGGALTGKVAADVSLKLTSVLDDLAQKALLKSGGVFDIDGHPFLDLSNLTTLQKGALGELVGEETVKKIIPDGQKLARAPGMGETGIDDLYKVNTPDIDYVVIEYKFVGSGTGKGSTRLGDTLDGKQASDGWILGSDRLEKSVGNTAAASVERAIAANRTETWVVTTRPDGSTVVEVLDSLGKTKNVDVSKILTGAKL